MFKREAGRQIKPIRAEQEKRDRQACGTFDKTWADPPKNASISQEKKKEVWSFVRR